MRVNAIIAEYNPFHNGHQYQLEASRQKTKADYTIVAMSGNFVQRGAPAILNKYARAEMALRAGADLVLEIPSYYACGSAEYFASGATALLDQLGVVDHLCFGSECGDISLLKQIAEILAHEPEYYKEKLKEKLRQGYAYPTARSFALLEYCPSLQTAIDIFASPNNILGIEYTKALLRRKSDIEPVTIKRKGAGYHEQHLENTASSAIAIRQAVFSGQPLENLAGQMPAEAYEILKRTWENSCPIYSNDFSLPLLYKLLSEETAGYDRYVDVTPELSDRIRKNIYQFSTFHSFCELLKTKDVTYTRLSRCLMHILLNMTDETLGSYQDMKTVPYARVLGLKKNSQPLLASIKANSSIPMISKLADAQKHLSPAACTMLQEDIRISHIYNGVAASKAHTALQNEYSTPMVIV